MTAALTCLLPIFDMSLQSSEILGSAEPAEAKSQEQAVCFVVTSSQLLVLFVLRQLIVIMDKRGQFTAWKKVEGPSY